MNVCIRYCFEALMLHHCQLIAEVSGYLLASPVPEAVLQGGRHANIIFRRHRNFEPHPEWLGNMMSPHFYHERHFAINMHALFISRRHDIKRWKALFSPYQPMKLSYHTSSHEMKRAKPRSHFKYRLPRRYLRCSIPWRFQIPHSASWHSRDNLPLKYQTMLAFFTPRNSRVIRDIIWSFDFKPWYYSLLLAWW